MKRQLISGLLALILGAGAWGAQQLGLFEKERTPVEVPAGASFMVEAIDVGQGDAYLITCDGETMLIDGGDRDKSDVMYTVLKKRGVEHLDVLMASHAHADHIGGLSGAAEATTVDIFYCPVTDYDSKTFDNLVKQLDKQGVDLTVPQAGDEFDLGSAQVEILGPVKDYSDANNTSIVVRVDFGETSFLFTGDMEAEAERDLLDAGADVDVDVLKVGHHGSTTSTCQEFLEAVSPEIALISVGKDNDYGHPHEEIVERLEGIDVYRTDLCGDILATSDGESVTITTAK